MDNPFLNFPNPQTANSTPASILKPSNKNMEFPLAPGVSIENGKPVTKPTSREALPGEQVYDFTTNSWITPQPTVTPMSAPGDLSGTMTTQSASITPASPGQGQGQGTLANPNTPVTSTTPNPLTMSQFASYMDTMKGKLKEQNDLASQRNLLYTALFSRPLTQDEINQLSPAQQQALKTGDKTQAEMSLRILNDSISGRTNTLNQSVEYLTNAYQSDLDRADQQKQNSLATISTFYDKLDDNGKAALIKMYPDLAPLINSLSTNQGGKFQKVGVDDLGNDIYGFVNEAKGTVQPYSSSSSGSLVSANPYDIGGFDIASYATDPTHEGKVKGLYDKINTATAGASPDQLTAKFDQYIKSVAPKSPVTGDMVMKASQEFNVDPALMLAIMQQDSSFGTAGRAVSTMNPGNVGNVDSGASRGFSSWEEGVRAVADNLNKRRISTATGAISADTVQVLNNSMNNIAPRLPVQTQKSSKASLKQYIAQGNEEAATQFIVSTAIAALPVAEQSKAIGRLEAIATLDNLTTLLSDYEAKGGNTGIFKGTEEDIMQKIGKTSDPELAYIQNQIATSIIDYRHAVSGAAFTTAEAKDYEKLFPSIGKVSELNSAKIRSLKDTFNRNEKVVLSAVLGQQNYDKLIEKMKKINTASTPGGGFNGTTPGGMKYEVIP